MHRLAPEGLEAALTAVVVMSLVVSATLNGQRPCTCLKDVPTRLPALPNSRIEELLPHRWPPPA